MTSQDLLKKYISFYEQRGHKLIPNVSLVPENDPTLLYVNSGMFPLVPYLSGEPHPAGKRLVNVQRCLRFNEDLENVGETSRHTTAFHMIGNWSLGDYFKKEQIPWVYEFIIEVLGLDIEKIYATVFEGDKDAPKDEEAITILKEVFAKYGIDAKEGERIFPCNKKHNWWQRGDAIGELGGPDSEIFYYIGKDGNGIGNNPAEDDQNYLEIGNSVFMQYKKTEEGWKELPQKNVDFGGGLERLAAAVQDKKDIFETDNFYPIIEEVEKLTNLKYSQDEKTTKAMRKLADHMRSAILLAMDGVFPSNKDQGYILRRLLRRMVRVGMSLGLEKDISVSLVPVVVNMFSWIYPDLKNKQQSIEEMFSTEEEKFRKTLKNGAREFEKLSSTLIEQVKKSNFEEISETAFNLYQSLGYPYETFAQDLSELDTHLSDEEKSKIEKLFKEKYDSHQEKSRKGAKQKFEGGLADRSEQTIRYHTATHLLNMALRKVLSEDISQHGSNITGERFRFDFNFDRKLTEEEISEVNKVMNEVIEASLPVKFVILAKEEALKTGAAHAFNEKYSDEVKVYYIGNSIENAVSKEFCGGPHVQNTSEIRKLEVFKQDKIGRGLMRVYVR